MKIKKEKYITKKKLPDYINDLKENRFEIQGALRKRDEKKIMNKKESEEDTSFDVLKEIKKFNKTFKVNVNLYNNMKDENDMFLKKYKIAKIFKNRNRPDGQASSGFHTTFADLITKYKEKNYKITDLSVKNNLFEPSPLLTENNKIVDDYRLGDLSKIYEKDLYFLSKTNNQIYEKPDNSDIRQPSLTNKKATIKLIEDDIKNKQKTIDEYILNIKSNDKIIKRTTKLLEENDFKTLFEEFKKENTENSKDSRKLKEYENGKPKVDKPKRQKIKKPQFLPQVKLRYKPIIEKITPQDKSKEITQYSILTTEYSTNREYMTTSSYFDKKKGDNEVTILEKDEEKTYNKTKEQIFEEINNKLEEKYKKIRNLENTFDRVVSERDAQIQYIFDYYEKEYGKDKKIIEENFHKKLEPSDIMKFIQEMKNKVNSLDIYETYQNFVSKLGNLENDPNDFLKIRELDNKINKMDLLLVKKLNKVQKILY